MDNSEDKKWLYDKLKANGLGISYKDFENTLGNEEDLKWYYDRANNIGLQVGSYDDFSTLFSSKPVSVAQQVIDEYDASMGNARSQEATNTQPSPSPTPAQPNMYDGSQFAQAFQAPDWRSEETKLMDEIATSGKATVATLDGVDRYPTKPLEVRYDESVREAASNATSQKQSAADQLNSLYDDINTQVDAIPRRVPRPYEAMAGLTDQQLEENRLRAAQRIVEDAKEALEEAGKKGNTNFVAGLGRGIADKIADPENWNFGITDLADNKYLLDALKKSEKGEELTPAEDKLLQAATTSMAVNYYYSQDLGRGYKAGKTTAESIPFMLEFMINPVSASGSGIAKSLLKYGMKKFGAKAVNRGITRAAGRLIGDAAGRLIGDAAAAAGMTATTGAARTLASSYEKQAENYDYRYDDTGNVVVQKTGDMGQGEALARGFLSNFLENQSEMVFGAFSGAGKSLSGIIPSIGKLSNIGLVRFYNSIKNAPLAKQLRDRAKIGGVVEEYAEEVYNNFANVAIGEMSAEDALSIDNNIDTFLGLVPTQLAFSAIGLGGLARENIAARRRLRTFTSKLSEEEKKRFAELQEAIRSGNNNNARDYIKATLANNNLTDQEKKERVFAARDLVAAQQAEQVEQEQTASEQETDASYTEGATAEQSTYYDRYKASQQAGAALEQVDPNLYETINRYVEDDASAGEVDNLLSGLEGKTEQLARTYLNSLMQLKGAEDAQMQAAVEAVNLFEQSVQQYAYQNEDGTRSITTGTYKERPVYVIPGDGGNVTVVYEDGSREMALSQYVEGQETTDYDEFIDSYNRSYLEEKEAAFRNFLENHPKTQQPAPGVVLHNGDVTYVVTNVSEDGYVDIVPATFDAETGQTVPKNGAAQQTISYSTAMMLQNDYYSALDNQGNTSINTGDSSNLSENKAENETRPSDGESNVSKSAVEDTPEQRLANFVATLPKKGKTEEIDYNAMTPQQRYEYTSLIESPEIAAEDLQADIAAKQKQLEAVQKKLESAVGGKRTEIRDQMRNLRNELKELTDYYQSIATPVQQEQVVQEVASQEQVETSQSLDDAVPDVVNDKASDARQRGYRMVNGQRVDRQDQIPMQQGRETDVRFSQNDTAKAKFAIVDATYLQPSHIGGVRNSLFFIDEAQPKDRVDNASVMAADRMARDIRPEEITGGVTAYTGSPVINSRGEVIQGNNRSAALRIMYQIPGADAAYREYLNQHAEDFGLTAEQINSVQSPVIVRVADISDNEAIRLGQMTAQDTESGGIERIKPTQTATKLGDSLQSFNRILLNSQEEDVSLSDLVSENGVQALKFLRQQGSISDTQYQSAFDANGNLTPEAKQDLIAILQTSLFEGGPDLLPQMFRALPAKAQKAILSTFVRDQQSPEESRIKKDIQNAIQAFYAAMQFPDFAKATNYESARNAIEQWKRQINMIDGVAPMQVFDNFALELAVRFKGYTMKRITDEFNSYYDLVQGAGADLFSDTASPVERGEAIRRIFNIQTNEQEGNDAVGSDNTGSEEGRSGSTGSSAGGERDQNEGGPSDTGGRTGTTDESEQVETSLSESPESANERRMNQIIERLDEIEYRLSELEGKTDIFSEAEQITLNNEKNELESEFNGLRKINATSAAIQEARNDVNPSPTEAQKEAGNYKKGHVTIDGLNITIENPKGSTRSGKDASGKEWSVTMQNDYGYIRGTKAVDGDHIDIFLSDNPTSGNVYVVDAIDQKTGAFDESKVMYGFNSLEEARDAYLSNYSEGWKVGPITEVSKEEFKKWIDSSTRKGKPFGEYKSVKSNVTDPQQLPKILKDAYESEDKASITNAETLLREYVDSQNNLKQISTTYFRSMDNLRKEKDKSSPSYKMNDFIAKTCKDALKKAGIAPDTLMSEKKRMEFANATKDANVLDVMSVDPSFDVLKAVVRNPNTSNNTLQNIADNTNYSYLSDEAKQILEERNSNQELANENQPNFSPNEPKETEQEEVKVESKDKFVGYKEFIDNLFEQEELILTPYKNLSEWKEKDEEYYANRYDARIDEFIKRYVSYIKELSDNGTLQRIYDHSSLKNQKEIRDNLADAGLEYKDYIDTKVNRKRIPQKADEKSDLKEGSEVNARFYDGTIVSGTIESIENNKIGIRTNNGRLYNVPLNRILDDDNNVLFRDNGILDEVNEQFNQELQQQIDGTLPNGHIYSLGNPSDILLSTGTPNLPIELSSTRLAEKSDQRNHEFAISDVKNLPEALQSPLAVFSYGDKSKAQNVIVELEKNGKKFVIGLHLNQIRKGIEVNSIRGLFPKNNAEWLNWINQNKALYLNKEKIQALIDKQRTNLADVEYLDLDSTTKIVENFENPKLEENNYREGQGPQTDESVSLANDPASRIAGAPRRSRKQQEEYAARERRRMENAANRMVEKLGLDNVEIVTDASTLEGDKAKAKGFYSPSTGKITIVLPNHVSSFDVEQTILHEAVAHYGLRRLFGDNFDTFLDNVYNNASAEIRERINKLAKKYNGNYRTATEEYLASLAEKTDFENAVNSGWFNKIKAFFLKMLSKAGINIPELTDNELRYILWRSYENLAHPGHYRNVFDTAADVAKQNELKVGNYAESKLAPNVAAENDVLFRESDETDIYDDQELNIVNKEVGSAREQYERTLKTAAFKFTEAWQDSMLGLKEAQDAIAKATNSRILDYENAYIAENAMSSISLAEMDAFRNLVLKPILQEVNNLKKQGAAYAEITDYLMLKHGIERNREMAVREALSGDKDTMQENMDRWNEEKKSVNESSGTWEEKQRQLDKIALTFGAELKDYSGMTDILPGYDNMEERTEEAYRIVNEFEEEYDTEALYDRIHAATDAILKKQVESGLMSKEMYQSISDMYEFYVPLRGWEEKTADEVYDYLTTEHSSFNAPVRKAKGRKSKADDPIANIANVAESGIVQGNRNLVKQRFLTMVQNHRTDLASVNNLWVQEVEREDKNGNTVKEWVAVFPEIAKDATPEQVERIMEAFNKRMEEKSKQEGSNVKRASDMVNIPYKILPKDLKEHQVVVKRAGKPYVITINGNPRAAQAINGLTNPNATENPFIKFVESANRFMAANFTQRNPAFVVANMVRDGIYANTSVWVKEGPLYAVKFNRNWAKSVKEMAGLVARYKANRLDMSNPTDRMFYDFIRNGGETGYTFINSVEDYKGIIQKEIKRANRKTLSPMKAVDVLGNAMDTFGRWAEDASRFAAYRTSREMSRSVSRSINDAKEISVNFNRKGAGAKAAGKWEKGNRINALQAWASQMARGLYIFWNAGVQGLTNFGRMARRNPGKFTAMASSYLVLGSLAPLINEVLCSALGGDDDDSNYYNLPEYVRRNNICLYVGGSWLTIPLPIELRALYGLGEMTCSFLTGKEKYKPVKVAGQISQILPIDFLEGSGGLNAFVPSYVKPLVEVYNNKSWTGIPIYRDNAFNKDMPNWTKAYKSTSPELIELAERINSFTGGTKYRKGSVDINPAAIEYLFKSYLGGVATTIDQVKKTAMMPFNEDMQDWRNVVIANRFLKNADERSTQKRINNEYFENKEEFDKVRQEFNGYRKELSRLNPNMEEFAKYRVLMDELIKSDRFRKYQEFHAMDKELNRMFEAFKENGSEELEEQMFILKEAMNEVARSK